MAMERLRAGDCRCGRQHSHDRGTLPGSCLCYIVCRLLLEKTMTRANPHEDLLPLSPPVFHILLALADADRHGYGILQEVQERTHGAVKLGPGTLYGAIKRLRDGGLIEEREDPSAESDERRRYYHLTGLG